MRCRALTTAGTRCQNARAPGEVFCARHLNQQIQPVMARETIEDILREQAVPRQPLRPVPYEAVAMVLRDSGLPREHVRTLATDLSEAFRERDEAFNVRAFLQVATS